MTIRTIKLKRTNYPFSSLTTQTADFGEPVYSVSDKALVISEQDNFLLNTASRVVPTIPYIKNRRITFFDPATNTLSDEDGNTVDLLSVSDSVTSTSSTVAASSKAVKAAYDLAASKTSNTGTVTSVTIKATSPIACDNSAAITTSGTRTLSHANSGVEAGTYGTSGQSIPVITVNSTGHIISASSVALSTSPTSGSAVPITSGGVYSALGNKADKQSVTAGTAGTSSNTSGSTLAVPYVTVTNQGVVKGYGTHTHTITGFAASNHNQAASTITAGTLAGKVLANAASQKTLTDPQVRNIYAGTSDMTPGTTALAAGTIYIKYIP